MLKSLGLLVQAALGRSYCDARVSEDASQALAALCHWLAGCALGSRMPLKQQAFRRNQPAAQHCGGCIWLAASPGADNLDCTRARDHRTQRNIFEKHTKKNLSVCTLGTNFLMHQGSAKRQEGSQACKARLWKNLAWQMVPAMAASIEGQRKDTCPRCLLTF